MGQNDHEIWIQQINMIQTGSQIFSIMGLEPLLMVNETRTWQTKAYIQDLCGMQNIIIAKNYHCK